MQLGLTDQALCQVLLHSVPTEVQKRLTVDAALLHQAEELLGQRICRQCQSFTQHRSWCANCGKHCCKEHPGQLCRTACKLSCHDCGLWQCPECGPVALSKCSDCPKKFCQQCTRHCQQCGKEKCIPCMESYWNLEVERRLYVGAAYVSCMSCRFA